jgi:uncharacterized protein with PQ loop repeat
MVFIYIVTGIVTWIIAGIITNKMFFIDNGNWIDFDEKLANIITGFHGMIFYIIKYRILKISKI